MSVLTKAKEIADTSADAYEAFRGGKTVGTEFDKGKLLYGIEETKNTLLKVLTATGDKKK